MDTCRTLGCAPPDLEEEFEQVGDLLVMLEERIREDLMPGPDLLELADPLTHLLGSWSLERAREAAWSAALVLWRLRDVPLLAEEFHAAAGRGRARWGAVCSPLAADGAPHQGAGPTVFLLKCARSSRRTSGPRRVP